MRSPLASTWWAASLLVTGVALPAAASLDVSPIRIELTKPAANALVTLTNTGKDTARYELRVVSWSQNEAGEMDLQPTRDVFLFPPLVTLQPGEKRNARVGVAPAIFGQAEKTYRLIVEELPAAPRPGAPAQVQVVTRLSIPIFAAPEKPVAELKIEGLALANGVVSMKVVNAGNVEQRPVEVSVEALDASGKLVAHERWDGWYVLAGGVRQYAWKVPAAACGSATELTAKVKFEQRELTARAQVGRGACAQ